MIEISKYLPLCFMSIESRSYSHLSFFVLYKLTYRKNLWSLNCFNSVKGILCWWNAGLHYNEGAGTSFTFQGNILCYYPMNVNNVTWFRRNAKLQGGLFVFDLMWIPPIMILHYIPVGFAYFPFVWRSYSIMGNDVL